MSIYFVRAESSGAVKIGRSYDPQKRLKALQTGAAEKLFILRCVPGDAAEERAFHKLFAPLRINGEWFQYSDEMLTAQVEPTEETEARSGRSATDEQAQFNERLRLSLLRHMRINGWTVAGQLAHAIGKSEDTATRVMRGEAQLSAADVYSLMAPFGPGFVAEVYEEAELLSPRDRIALEIGRKALEIMESAA